MSKAVVLLSGGVDSSTCLGLAVFKYGASNVTALSIIYGQKHVVELNAAVKVAEYFGVDLKTIDITPVMQFSNCSLMANSTEEIPEQSYAEQIAANGEGRVNTYVPYRNGTLLSVATAVAVSIYPDGDVYLFYGAHSDDAAGNAYADCSPEFIKAQAEAINIGTYGKVILEAPLARLNKSHVVRLGLDLSKPVPYHLTHSCYKGIKGGCGVCGTCIDRAAAFKANGIEEEA